MRLTRGGVSSSDLNEIWVIPLSTRFLSLFLPVFQFSCSHVFMFSCFPVFLFSRFLSCDCYDGSLSDQLVRVRKRNRYFAFLSLLLSLSLSFLSLSVVVFGVVITVALVTNWSGRERKRLRKPRKLVWLRATGEPLLVTTMRIKSHKYKNLEIHI